TGWQVSQPSADRRGDPVTAQAGSYPAWDDAIAFLVPRAFAEGESSEVGRRRNWDRYAEQVSPVSSRNAVASLELLENPLRDAIFSTGRSVLASSRSASLTCARRISCSIVRPRYRRNPRSSFRWPTGIARRISITDSGRSAFRRIMA